MTEIVRVLRVVEYIGPRDWVERTIAKSIHGTKFIDDGKMISAATIGEFPEILNKEVEREHGRQEDPSEG